MKQIIVLRHAKSSWDNLTIDDYDRELNERGKNDATLMSQLFGQKVAVPDAIVCSGARRVIETLEIMKEHNSRLPDYTVNENLYLAEENILECVISETPNDINTLMICGHNPGLSDLVREMTGKRIEDIPTNSVVVVDTKMDEWTDIYHARGVIEGFYFPKMFKEEIHHH